jgi:signal transduction histidine kinase
MRMSYRARLFLGFGTIFVVLIVMAVVRYQASSTLIAANEWVLHSNRQLVAAHEVSRAIRIWVFLVRGSIDSGGHEAELEEARLEARTAIDAFTEATEAHASIEDAEADDLVRVAELQELVTRIDGLVSEPGGVDVAALAQARERVIELATEVEENELEELDDALAEARGLTAQGMIMTMGMITTVVVLLGALLLVLSSRLSTGISALVRATERISTGDLSARAPVTGSDEFTALAKSFNKMVIDLGENIEARERANAKAKQLARDAGVAQVTTGVLHNIGNALTSMKISLELLDGSRVSGHLDRIARLGNMLAEHKGDLERFLLRDPRGSKVTEYLMALAPELERDRDSLRSDLERSRERMEHIVRILRAYQEHGRATLEYEQVRLRELVDFALEVSLSSTRRAKYRVRCELPALSSIRIDKHRTLQILINLIRNAADAIDEAREDGGTIEIVVSRPDDHMVAFAIVDDGVGIAVENLERIFNHGFTTKSKEASGFGLHTSANAASEMGGRLTVHSDGPGKGARFLLELPYRDDEDSMAEAS